MASRHINDNTRRLIVITESQADKMGILQEIRYLDVYNKHKADPNGSFKQDPLRNDETIRVFHGCGEIADAVIFAKYGLSGMGWHPRVYSYESGMNPHGLFVTVNPDIALDFAKGYKQMAMIEFSTKVTQLDFPVWNGQDSYFGQGSNPEPFRNKAERDEQKKKYQDDAISDKNNPQIVKLSDNPRLMYSLLCNNECQALFVGNLNPNQIKRFWVKEKGGRWTKYSRKDFLRKYGDIDIPEHIQRAHNYVDNKQFLPDDDFTSVEDLALRLARGKREEAQSWIDELNRFIKKAKDENGSLSYAESLIQLMWPKQLMQLMGEDWFRDYCSKFYDDPVYNQFDGKERPQMPSEVKKILTFAQKRIADGFTLPLGKDQASPRKMQYANENLPRIVKCQQELIRLFNEHNRNFTLEDAQKYYQDSKKTEFHQLSVELLMDMREGYSLLDLFRDYSDQYKKLKDILNNVISHTLKSIEVDGNMVTATTQDLVLNDLGFVEEYKDEQTKTFKIDSIEARKLAITILKDDYLKRTYNNSW